MNNVSQSSESTVAIRYVRDKRITPIQFCDLLQRSGLDARRPVDNPVTIAAMLEHADLSVTAWRDEVLVGVARSLTDFHYCCYLSDLAVDRALQRQGVGRQLVAETRSALGPGCMLLLLSAPAAVDYYPHTGFERHPQAWLIRDAGTERPTR
ncbi:MAG: GNAT family N-acetyltransferase [Gammaproteobacteria bacterium]|nr:MAG: GNAT family N-acetyltransferase [Gammaproteobacteria bacterium]